MEDSEEIVCPSCTHSCPGDAHFCPHCRSPISSYAATGPFESIFAEGAAYRRAVSSPTKPIILVGVWLIFFPFACSGIFAAVFLIKTLIGSGFTNIHREDLYLMIWGLALGPIGAFALYQTTRNYISTRRTQNSEQDESLKP